MRLPRQEEMIDGWSRERGRKQAPWAAWGDFNGDGLTDVAVMAIDESGGKHFWRVLAFLQTDNARYEMFEIERYHEMSVEPRGNSPRRIIPPPRLQDFVLRTASAGSPHVAYPGKKHRFDAPMLIRVQDRDKVQPHDGIFGEWRPQYHSLEGVAFGDMAGE